MTLPDGLGYDAWAWLVWGREVLHLDLNTAGGPSWKPLPVIATTVFAIFGGAAPTLWAILARASALFAVALAYRLGARLAGPVAGALAALALVLVPGWVDAFIRDTSEPLLVALLLWAVERHLADRRDQAFVLTALAALLRPEVWPFLLLYAAILWRAEPGWRRVIAVIGLAVPVLWFGGDLLGSGDALTGGGRARTEAVQVDNAAEAVVETVALPVWLGALAAVALAVRANRSAAGSLGERLLGPGARGDDVRSLQRLLTRLGLPTVADGDFGPATEAMVRRYERVNGLVVDGLVSRGQATHIAGRARTGPQDLRTLLLLGAGALAWIALVFVLSALGYAGLGRFVFPAAAVLCVLAGVGVVRLVDAAPSPRARLLAAGLIAALVLPFAIWALAGPAAAFDESSARTDSRRDLAAIVDQEGRDALLACGELGLMRIEGQSVLAWELDVPMVDVQVKSPRQIARARTGTVFARDEARVALERRAAQGATGERAVRPLAAVGSWGAFAVGCAPEA